jgi:carboxymethylenebutenolidase
MGESIKLKAKDGVTIAAYQARPEGTPKGGIVVVQAIFGVNGHVMSLVDRHAGDGYLAIAPSLFDRTEPGVVLGYAPSDIEKGIELRSKTRLDDALGDIETAVQTVAPAGPVGIVGYCWGGTLSYASACRVAGLKAAVSYYGYGIDKMLDEKPQVPVMLHFGRRDDLIAADEVETIRRAFPKFPLYVYDAGHGFVCDERDSYDKASAELAAERTNRFFAEHLR